MYRNLKSNVLVKTSTNHYCTVMMFGQVSKNLKNNVLLNINYGKFETFKDNLMFKILHPPLLKYNFSYNYFLIIIQQIKHLRVHGMVDMVYNTNIWLVFQWQICNSLDTVISPLGHKCNLKKNRYKL